jgi:hypothetical protein
MQEESGGKGGDSRLSYKCIHHNVVAETSSHNKQMKNLM